MSQCPTQESLRGRAPPESPTRQMGSPVLQKTN